MKNYKKVCIGYLLAVLISLFMIGCNRDAIMNQNNNPVHITTGAYILNEGGFNPNTSSLSFYSYIKDSIYNNIFKPGNLGIFPDGLLRYNDLLFITEQGNYGAAGKIYKCDTNGVEILSNSIGKNPYSLCIANNKLYVTNGPANNVSVVDINSLAVIKTINVGIYPQEILSFGNYVYVCNTYVYGGATDSTVSVIDNTTDNVVKTIIVSKSPSSIAKSRTNTIIVCCAGTSGTVYVIDPTTNNKIDSIAPVDFGKDLSVDFNSDNVYFISNSNNIIALDLNLKTVFTVIANPNPSGAFFNGYVFDYKNKIHYVANAGDFTSKGFLYIYDFYGNLLNSFQIGVSPRRILLNSQ